MKDDIKDYIEGEGSLWRAFWLLFTVIQGLLLWGMSLYFLWHRVYIIAGVLGIWSEVMYIALHVRIKWRLDIGK